MSFSVILALLLCTEAPGSSAVTPVFVQKGKDLRLEVREVHEEMFILSWRLNKHNVLIRFIPGGEPVVSIVYTTRIEFSEDSYSVTLKNVQEADSGEYTAILIGAEQEQILAEYSVTVQDAVSPVELKVDSVPNSSKTCNVTATCSTVDSHISSTFRCDTKTCSQEGGERSEVSNSGASLHLYLSNESIICNHSNQVSWIKNKTKIQDFCSQHATDAASPVELKVDSVSNSSQTCNVTATCSTVDSHISSTFRCDTKTCSQEGGERSEVTNSGASLHLYLVDESIICNHSNQVSSVKDVKNIFEDFCPRFVASESLSDGISVCLVKTVVFSVGLIIMVSAIISVHLMEKLKKK